MTHDHDLFTIAASLPEPGVAYVKGSDTSKAAAISMAGLSRKLDNAVLAYIARQGVNGATCQEVEWALDGLHQSISAAVSRLKKQGLVRDSGDRRLTQSGRKAAVMVAARVVA